MLESIQIALEGLKANKMRSLLTTLGIIIGISAVISIVTIGDAMGHMFSSQIDQMGAANINVTLRPQGGTAPHMGGFGVAAALPTQYDLITDEMIEQLYALHQENIVAISTTEVLGTAFVQSFVRYSPSTYTHISLTGTNSGFLDTHGIDILEGRFLTADDLEQINNAAVISDYFAQEFFPHHTHLSEAIGQEIFVTLGGFQHPFIVVGVYDFAATIPDIPDLPGFGGPMHAIDEDAPTITPFYIPITTASYIAGVGGGYRNFVIRATHDTDFEYFTAQIRDFFAYFYDDNPRFTIATISTDSFLTTILDIIDMVSIGIAVIAGISLIVGGVGVMNIMLVSITERTREIGTRKALGAQNAAILRQFIIEAMVLCLVGGVIGVAFGALLGYIATSILGHGTLPSLSIIAISVVFSMFVGLFFGFYPARKAAKLDPVEALRYE
ncbi:MAG: ABC transporter permease [Defluviitaleaceae bacterium]|nr:ABC transporter permease [Defluviitaleaceae bacterium]